MSADNFNKRPDNSTNQDEELTSILQRLSSLLDKSVSLDDAIELAKKQSNEDSFENDTVIKKDEATFQQDNTEIKQEENIVELLEQQELDAEELPLSETENKTTEETVSEKDELDSYAELIKKLHTDATDSVAEKEEQDTAVEEDNTVTEETAIVEDSTPVNENTTDEVTAIIEENDTEAEEAKQTDKSMPVSDFIKLLKTKRFTDEVEQSEESEEQNLVTADTTVEEENETIPVENEIVVEEKTQTEEKVFDDEAELVTEKKQLAEEYTDTQEAEKQDPVTSKIFDELLACFDEQKLPDDLRFSDVDSKETPETEEAPEAEITEDVSTEEQETEDTEQQPTPEFVPIEHENPEEDELFSKIFSEEKSERKNREKDKKKWQNQGNEPSPFLSGLYDWLEVIVLSAAFALLLFTFILRIAIVDGDSMNHTLHDKELLIISDLMYTPDNNDIIVFTSPNYPEPIVKRIIATSGQTVDIDFDTWTVTVDGKVLKEDYINRVAGIMKSSDVAFPLTVPEGYIFVMGDNRNDSLDSRNSRIGFVDERYILGEVKLRLFPFNRFGTVD